MELRDKLFRHKWIAYPKLTGNFPGQLDQTNNCPSRALLKYFGGPESAQSQSTSSGSTMSDESGPSPSSTVLSHTPPSSVPTVPSMSETTADLSTTSTTTSPFSSAS
nr:mucin-2-like [Nerophis lumbriciformis]